MTTHTRATTDYPRSHGVTCPECFAPMMDPTPAGSPGDSSYYCDGCGFDLPIHPCRYCGLPTSTDSTDRGYPHTLASWHATAECVAAVEPSERMGGPR